VEGDGREVLYSGQGGNDVLVGYVESSDVGEVIDGVFGGGEGKGRAERGLDA